MVTNQRRKVGLSNERMKKKVTVFEPINKIKKSITTQRGRVFELELRNEKKKIEKKRTCTMNFHSKWLLLLKKKKNNEYTITLPQGSC